jgi:hypothetical protein
MKWLITDDSMFYSQVAAACTLVSGCTFMLAGFDAGAYYTLGVCGGIVAMQLASTPEVADA